MSKRALKEFLGSLPKKELELQLLDLYERFPMVKEYYDFIFNPKEDKLIQEAKTKIANEYFPVKRKRARMRRSIAQKYIKHFLKLGVESHLIADLMLFNLEIAQTFASEKKVADTFYKSMLNSFDQAVVYISQQSLLPEFKNRMAIIYTKVEEQQWPNYTDFSSVLDKVD